MVLIMFREFVPPNITRSVLPDLPEGTTGCGSALGVGFGSGFTSCLGSGVASVEGDGGAATSDG